MACAKGIIYKNICQRSQLLAEIFFVLCFFLSVTGVFQKHNIAVLHCCNRRLCIFTDYIVILCENNLLVQ